MATDTLEVSLFERDSRVREENKQSVTHSREKLSQWVQFFIGAGVPPDHATKYAFSFCDNRIQENMLDELNKDYLQDLGITVLGDVINILKYAKNYNTKITSPQVVRKKATLKPSAKVTAPSKEAAKKSARIITRHVEKDVNLPSGSQTSLTEPSDSDMDVKIVSSSSRKVTLPGKIVISQKEEVPVPKSRRVLPEHEGGYKIYMPEGKTAKTAHLLSLQKGRRVVKPAAKVTGVFSRVGTSRPATKTRVMEGTKRAAALIVAKAAAEASNARKETGDKIEPTITVTGLGKFRRRIPNERIADNGIFSRLGNTQPSGRPVKRPAHTTQPDDYLDEEPEIVEEDDSAAYIGVLKNSGAKRIRTAMVATRLAATNAKSRLGTTLVKNNIASGSSSIKTRLGNSSDSTVSSTSSIYGQRGGNSKITVANRKPGLSQIATIGATSGGVFGRLGTKQ